MDFWKHNSYNDWIRKKQKNQKRLIMNKKIELAIKILPIQKTLGLSSFIGEFYKTIKGLIQILLKLFQNTEDKGTFPDSIMFPTLPWIKNQIDSTSKENYRPIFLMNIDAEIPNKTLSTYFKSTLNELHIKAKWDLSVGYKDVSAPTNQ